MRRQFVHHRLSVANGEAGAQLLAALSSPVQFETSLANPGGETLLRFVAFQITAQPLARLPCRRTDQRK
jgi:hypothetical protein